MNRYASIFGALILFLTLWTSVTASAAERYDCLPSTYEVSNHFEGDREQEPSSPDEDVAHHHCGCHGHHVAATASRITVGPSGLVNAVPFAWREGGVPGRGPDADRRPPIA